ncbi:MAG: hypothetical protein LAO51_15895 [Acidobacteriia bacterium]|nr:hypothetical protein [Terriglobia bacterium]
MTNVRLAREMQGLALDWLTVLYRAKGVFPVRFKQSSQPRHFAWTSAEALVAFFEARKPVPQGSVETVLGVIQQSLWASPRGGKLVLALGEFPLDRGVVDSSVRAVLALAAIRYDMLKNGIERYRIGDLPDERFTSVYIGRLVEELLTGIEAEANDKGGWGTFYGETSRVDPTSHALAALIRCRHNSQSYERTIDDAVKWLREAQKDAGWGATKHSEEPDPGNTALVLSALSLVLPVTEPLIVDGVNFLRIRIQKGLLADTIEDLRVADGGMGPIHQGISIPACPRVLQALLACGIDPRDECVQKLLARIYAMRRDEQPRPDGTGPLTGWGLETDSNSTWYTSIVAYACSDYLRYAEYAGNRVDDLERAHLVTRMETLAVERSRHAAECQRLEKELEKVGGDLRAYRSKNVTSYRTISYGVATIALFLGLLLSLTLHIIAKCRDSVVLDWLAGSVSLSSFITVCVLTYRFIRHALPGEAPPAAKHAVPPE